MAQWRSCRLAALLVTAIFGAAVAASSGAAARPLIPAERRFAPFDGILPDCADPGALEWIRSDFRDRESEFWKTGLEIVGFERMKEIGYRSNGLDYIPRRYCTARVYLNDGQARAISYSMVKDLGFRGVDFGVQWCVNGFDRNDAYAPNCLMARP
jgi:hypothetical protein